MKCVYTIRDRAMIPIVVGVTHLIMPKYCTVAEASTATTPPVTQYQQVLG